MSLCYRGFIACVGIGNVLNIADARHSNGYWPKSDISAGSAPFKPEYRVLKEVQIKEIIL